MFCAFNGAFETSIYIALHRNFTGSKSSVDMGLLIRKPPGFKSLLQSAKLKVKHVFTFFGLRLPRFTGLRFKSSILVN
jgi:hypothetical protein